MSRVLLFGALAVVAGAFAAPACSTYSGTDDATDAGPDGPAQADTGAGGTSDGAAATDASTTPPCAGLDCACTKSSDCVDPVFSKCHNGACRECSTSPDSCPTDSYCSAATLTCVPGCKDNSSCAGSAKHCDPVRHRCVECLGNTDCPTPKTCSPGGACADACGSGTGPCPGGKSCCGQLCVDTKTDRFNCNACGNVCPGANPQCCNGSCVDASNDSNNCGTCGFACNRTQAVSARCNSGSCSWSCNAGYGHCTAGNTGCETQTTTVTRCGGCNVNCNTTIQNASGATCTNSACNYATCNSGFRDDDGNRANGCEGSNPVALCGMRDQQCCASNTCSSPNDRCFPNGKCGACLQKDTSCLDAETCCSGECLSNAKCE